MAHKQHGAPFLSRNGAHLAQAFALEGVVANGKDLVDDQNLRLEVGGHGEGQPDVHAAGIMLHRRVEELLHLGKRHDLVEFPPDLRARHPEDRAIEENVLAAAQLGMKPRADLEQRRHPAAQFDAPCGRLGDPRENLEEGRLARAVAADDSDDLAALDFKRHVAQRPKLLFLKPGAPTKPTP